MTYPTFKYVTFNPAKAKKWFQVHIETGFGNRNLSALTIGKYTRSMLRAARVTPTSNSSPPHRRDHLSDSC